MTPRRITALALATLTAAALTACTPTTEPTETPTASASETPSATPAPTEAPSAPTQEPVDAPTDSEDAVLDANRAYEAYKVAYFEFLTHPELEPSYLEGFVLDNSPEEKAISDTRAGHADDGMTVEGEGFGWKENLAMSYAAPITDPSTGDQVENGAVTLYGCSDNYGVDFLIDGEPVEEIPKGSFPHQVTLYYLPPVQAWFVTEDNDITGQDGAPQC